MTDEEKKPEEKKNWGFKMPDFSSAIKGVTQAAKAASDKAVAASKQASAKAAEVAREASAKAAQVSKKAQDKMRKEKSAEDKEKNKPSP